jgi:flagellar L-ring protein precursor FlgH
MTRPYARRLPWLLLLVTLSARAESLYNEGTFRPFTGDNRASRVGDLITVQVYENSSASSTTDTSTQRKNGMSASLGTSAINGGRALSGSLAVGGDFDGGGTTQRANKLLATLTVSVREVLPNGDLKIAGEQLLTVNGEKHKVKIEGRVRPDDIAAGNVVLSTRLADARLVYAGDGELSERAKRSWWRRLLDALGF